MKIKFCMLALVSALLASAPPAPADQGPAAPAPKEISDKSKEIIEQPGWQLGDPLAFWDGKATVDVEIRERFEYRENWIDFNDAVDVRDDVGLMQRLRLGLKLQPADWLTLYAQMQDSRTFFDEPAGPVTNREFVLNDSPYDLRQAYANFGNLFGEDLSLTVGRQILSYGKQRLVGAFEWDNNARTFDAVKVAWKTEDFSIDYFAGYVVKHQTGDFNSPDSEDLFTGIYGTYTGLEKFSFDAYLLYRSKSDVETSTVFTDFDEQTDGNIAPAGDYLTVGTRWETKKDAFGPWDANTEFALQVGEVSNPTGFGPLVGASPVNVKRQDLLAFASHLEGGYTFKSLDWKPRVYLEYNFATGDGDPNDGHSNTFQNLFPTNHLFYGNMDRFSWQNMHNVAFGTQFAPVEKLKVKAAYYLYWLWDTDDVWRFAGQGAVGGAGRYGTALPNTPSNFVGSEFDLTATYAATKWWTIEAGYAHFFAEGYIGDTAGPTGAEDDADFAYLQSTFKF